MKDWINIGALVVVGVTVLGSLGALALGVELSAVLGVAGPVLTGCFAIVNRGSVQ